ncbi:hypothetical protein FQR65_LT02147 [Abscondita terminalis]|nr:hypothetical protein FQR65_LT02147 [Abscondita terminalis]
MKAFLVVLLVAGAYGAPRLHKPKIIGGSDAAEGEFPYQASIRMFGLHNCGGSIISTKSVLTAAHCYFPLLPMQVVVGTTKLFGEGDSYDIQEFKPHPDFNMELLHSDVAVINLVKEIVLSDKIQPIALNTANVVAGSSCTLTGWGLTSFPGLPLSDLQKIELKTLANDVCGQMHAGEGVQVYNSQVCTLTKEGEGACMGDSGGPLFKTVNKSVLFLGEYRAA